MGFLQRLFGREHAPETPPSGDPVRIAEVEAVLVSLRPLFEADGGDIRLVAVGEDGDVHVRLRGACSSCAASPMTLFEGLEPRLRATLTWFRRLEQVG